MKKLLIILILIAFVAISYSEEAESPIEAITDYFEYFNNVDKEALNKNSDSPFIFVIGNKKNVYESYGDAVDFEGLKKTGWSYSSINTIELIYKDDVSAMVDINFSRFNKDKDPISTTDVIYLLLLKDNQWKVKSAFVQGNLSLGKDE